MSIALSPPCCLCALDIRAWNENATGGDEVKGLMKCSLYSQVSKEARERRNAKIAASSFMRKRKERTMKRSKSILFASAVLAATLALPRLSTAAEGEASASLGVYSNYVWRGQTLSTDAVVQPTVGLSWKGFGANLWANLDTDNPGNNSNLWSETDFTLSYDGAYEKLGYGFGWIYYSVVGADTQEFYATMSYDTILSPSLTIYYDTDAFAGIVLRKTDPRCTDKLPGQ